MFKGVTDVSDILYVNGSYIAQCGYGNAFYVSFNLKDWQLFLDGATKALPYGNGVLLCTANTIYYTVNGKDLTSLFKTSTTFSQSISLSIVNELFFNTVSTNVLHGANNNYAYASLYVSQNLTNWTEVTLPGRFTLEGITYQNGKYLVSAETVPPSRTCTLGSTNGIDWLETQSTPHFGVVGYMNGSYVLFDSGSGTYYTSQDPLETNTAKLNLLYDAGGNHFQWLAYGNGTYVGMARAYNQGCATAYVSNAQDTPGKPFPIDIAVYPVITIYGKAGYSYDIQFSIWPNGPWQTMTNIQITSDTYLWIDHTYPYPRKYYRAVLSP